MKAVEQRAVNAIRLLAADAIQKANSGHPGLPIGSAPMAYALWRQMKHNPKNPGWHGRDRFILSAGHASMLEYALLHLFGYGVTIDDIKGFRQWGSKTPGHPEYGHTPGVEATTGPLGQGFAMAVGMAMAEKHMAAVFNRPGFEIVNNYTYTLMGDGCMMEGVTAEAASLAGTLGLSKLIALYDSNRITIEGQTDIAFTENAAARFTALNWQVITVDNGEDINAVATAIALAKDEPLRPTLIIVSTNIAHGTAKEGKASAHGEPLGDENIRLMRETMGWEHEPFVIPSDVYAHFNSFLPKYQQEEEDYNAMMRRYQARFPELYAQWEKWLSGEVPDSLKQELAAWQANGPQATRASSGELLNLLANNLPNLFGGSADLAPSNKSYLNGKGDFSMEYPEGRNIHFGIREFAMAAACNGMALYGGIRAYCATFLVFSDYLKPALRLSALMKLPVMYVLTHDSIGVGEDGPTHQPIEHLASLRAIPGVQVFRPADARETAACYLAALESRCPSVFALSRQNLPQLTGSGSGAARGGYILRDSSGEPDVILIASGSEVELIVKAADMLAEKGCAARVVSMPSPSLFNMQDKDYRDSVLPDNVRARVAVEAGSSIGWSQFTGLDGKVISIDHFGASAPAPVLFREYGFTPEAVAEAALAVMRGE